MVTASYIHMTPEEAARAALDLGARALMPAHVGRFAIANHAWDDPFARLAEVSRGKSYRLLTPGIGEPVALDDTSRRFSNWWEAYGNAGFSKEGAGVKNN